MGPGAILHQALSARLLRMAVLLALSILPSSPVRAVDVNQPKTVLVIYDENKDFVGLSLLDQSLRATLKRDYPGGLNVYTEYLDVSRFHDPDYAETLTN